MQSDREMTIEELAWWRGFKRMMQRLPRNVELNARIGEIGIAPSGSREEIFNRDGDADNFGDGEWEALTVPRFDGRDSQL